MFGSQYTCTSSEWHLGVHMSRTMTFTVVNKKLWFKWKKYYWTGQPRRTSFERPLGSICTTRWPTQNLALLMGRQVGSVILTYRVRVVVDKNDAIIAGSGTRAFVLSLRTRWVYSCLAGILDILSVPPRSAFKRGKCECEELIV